MSSSSVNHSTNTTTPSYYQAKDTGVVIPPGGEEDDHNLMDEEELPVRAQHRAVRSTPDPEEPSFSYKETMSHWIMVEKTGFMEEDFDGRLRNGPRRESGGGSGSFWRTSDAGSPSSHSVCTHPRGNSSFTENGALDSLKSSDGSNNSSSNSTSLLSVAIAEHERNSNTNGNNNRSSSATRSAIQAVVSPLYWMLG